MEVENGMCPILVSFHLDSFRVIFHFHDYGRKGRYEADPSVGTMGTIRSMEHWRGLGLS